MSQIISIRDRLGVFPCGCVAWFSAVPLISLASPALDSTVWRVFAMRGSLRLHPLKAPGIAVEGENKWLTIHNAKHEETRRNDN
jgi:hypothetical protein